MKSPFEDMLTPFDCFYDTAMTIRFKSGADMTITVSVFQDMLDEPLSEESLDTNQTSMTFLTQQNFVGMVNRGDIAEVDGTQYTIQNVDWDNNIGCIIKARQK